MLRFKFALTVAPVILLFAITGAGHAQNKPLKKIRVGVPSVGMAEPMAIISANSGVKRCLVSAVSDKPSAWAFANVRRQKG